MKVKEAYKRTAEIGGRRKTKRDGTQLARVSVTVTYQGAS